VKPAAPPSDPDLTRPIYELAKAQADPRQMRPTVANVVEVCGLGACGTRRKTLEMAELVLSPNHRRAFSDPARLPVRQRTVKFAIL
jgi:hypothetical protein